MLHSADMDPNLLGAVDDSIDPNIFNLFDVTNSAVSPNLEDGVGFTWADDLISSAELDPSNSTSETSTVNQVSVQQASSSVQQQVATATQQQLLQSNVVQQQMTASVGGVPLMAMGGQQQQQQQQSVVAGSTAGGGQTQVLQNQSIIQSSMSSQQMASPFILKTNAAGAASSIQVANATSTIAHPFLPSSTTLVTRTITPSQSPSPHLSRSLTPSQTLSIGLTQTQPQQIAVTAAGHSNINLVQINQSQVSQQVPLQSFVTNQTAQQNNLLQGHAVLASHGSNIVHTQNALIQNPNVVNVNVAHVLPNQLNLQGTLIQTPQGKFLIQSQPGSQQLPGQLNLGTLGQVQMAGGVGLGQTTVMAQPSNNVIGNSGVTQQQQQQPNFSLVNLGGPQGQQILIQRSPAAAQGVQATPSTPVGQANLILRTVTPNQQLLQQPQLHATAATSQTLNMATTQVPQQIVTQAGATQNLQLQQLIAAGGGQSLRLVGQPSTTPQQSQGQTTLGGNVLLQPVVGGNQQVRLIGQQQQAQAGSKPGTVTLNLGGQNLSLQQLQSLGGIGGMQGIQLATTQQPQFVVQQQQQQQVQPATSGTAVVTANVASAQQNGVQTVTQQVNTATSASSGSSKKSKSKSTTGTSTNSASSLFADNILSQALTASGIEPEDMMDLFSGGAASEDSVSATTPQPQPPPSQSAASKSKKKKKKKEPAKDVAPVQPVVLSSTKDISGVKTGLSTASATTVTTTISQAAVALPGQASQAGSLGTTHLTISGQTIITSTTAASAQPVIGMPAVALNSQSAVVGGASITTTTTTLGTSPVQTASVRGGKHGPPNVSVKPMVPNLQVSLAEKQQLLNIQTELQRLQNKVSLTEADMARVQQLMMQRKKILAQAQSQAIINQQKQQQQQQQRVQQQVTLTSNMVGQPLVAQPQASPAQPQQRQQQQPQHQLKLEVKPLTSQAQTITSTNSVLQIQAKPATTLPPKLKLVSPKVEPGVAANQTETAQDSKPVLVASSGTIVTQATVGSVMSTQTTQGMLQAARGNVVMAMPSQGVGQVTNKNVILPAQQNVVRLQIAQKTQSVTMSSATPQQVIVPSPQKVTVVANGSGGTVMSAGTAVQHVVPMASLGPSQARPVQIKIANQVLTLQLTPPQQEKLELHLSRMTLEQQQGFLRTQQHILAKLQLRTEPVPGQQTQVTAGRGASGAGGSAAVVAPTVVAAVSAGGDANQKVVMAAPTTVNIATQQQQLPVTVQQVLESTQNKTDSSQSTQGAGVKRVHVPEIPKASMIHQQLSKDQDNALAPDTKNPFKDYREACRRLLRYHTFQSPGPPPEMFEEADRDFESMSEDLVEEKDAMLAKYRLLLMEESMRGYPTAEMVFILRMLNQDMHGALREDRQIIEKDPESFVPMPAQYLEQKAPKAEESDDEEEDKEEEEEEEEEEIENDDEDIEEGDSKQVHSESEGEVRGEVDDNSDDEGCDKPVQDDSKLEDEDDDVEDVDSVSEPAHDQLESVNTSYDNTSYDDSIETPSSPPREETTPKSNTRLSPSPIIPSCSSNNPSHGIFKLVIRNDGKGFTSRLASERRKSMSKGKHRKQQHPPGGEVSEDDSRHRTSGSVSPEDLDEDGVEHKVSDESSDDAEFTDVDKYSRNVSVKLERLSDTVSQVYSVGGKSPSAGGSGGGGSSRKRKKGEVDGESGRHKRDKHSVTTDNMSHGAKVKITGGKGCEGYRTGGGIESSPKHSKSRLSHDSDTSDRGHRVKHGSGSSNSDGSAKHRKDLNQGSSSRKGRLGLHDDDVATGEEDPCSSVENPEGANTDPSTEMQSAIDSIMELQEEQFMRQQQDYGSHDVDLDDLVPESPLQEEEDMHPPAFTGQIPADLIQTEKMFNLSSSDNEMETSFEHEADPQRSMMNPEMQHAIDSILNGSGGSGEGGQGGEGAVLDHNTDRTLPSLDASPAQDSEAVNEERVDESDDDSVAGRTGHDTSGVNTEDSQDVVVEDDLDAAVQSILM